MYNPIDMFIPRLPKVNKQILESFKLNLIPSDAYEDIDMNDEYLSEAVFSGGKEALKPILEKLDACKQLLMNSIKTDGEVKTDKEKASSSMSKFNPTSYWRSKEFKSLEDTINKTFGFRHVEINPFIEKYNSKTGDFESKLMYGAVYFVDRYPIDGLVTDSGFYDKSHSLVFDIRLSLGLIKALSSEEILAVLLHEIGHNIDPAAVDIKYAQTNVLSKYLTDRKEVMTNGEKKVIKGKKNIFLEVLGLVFTASLLATLVKKLISKFESDKSKQRKLEKKLDKIRQMVANDKEEFNRVKYSEAFADNFARMYGYGPQLISGIKKMSKDVDNKIRNRYKLEKERQDVIISITKDCMNDEHKTDIHRIRSLIKECKADLNDPNIPAKVKKDIQSDLDELEKLLNSYQKDFSTLQNRINTIINEELEKVDNDNSKEDDKKPEDK